MTVVTATRRIQFAAGHRVYGHEGKCRNMHGHNYVALVTAAAFSLDPVGRVVDFSVLKDRIGGWIDEHWDHGFLVWEKDAEVLRALAVIPNQKKFLMLDNPTAENMARWLLSYVGPKVLEGTGVKLTKVVVWETENCFAEVEVPVESPFIDASSSAGRLFLRRDNLSRCVTCKAVLQFNGEVWAHPEPLCIEWKATKGR